MARITAKLRHLALLDWEQYGAASAFYDGQILLNFPFTLRAVTGQAKKLRLFLMATHRFSSFRGLFVDRDNAPSGYLSEDEDGLVAIYVPLLGFVDMYGDATGPRWRDIIGDRALNEIKATLRHELIHASDVVNRKSKKTFSPVIPQTTSPEVPLPYGQSKESWKEQATYYNRKHELRAHTDTILNDVRDIIKLRLRRFRRKSGSGSVEFSVSDALRQSRTWNEMEPYLTPKNRNLVLKTIVTALEDERIIKVR
jgi:hypothetical protein